MAEHFLVSKEKHYTQLGDIVFTETWRPLSQSEATTIRAFIDERRQQIALAAQRVPLLLADRQR